MKYNLLLLISCIPFLLPVPVHGADVNYIFNVANSVVAPDGFQRAGVIVNGAFPGPLIQAQKTDALHITVNNQLTDPNMRRSATVHWHGLYQFRTASEDGPAGVNQCPIAPGHSYTYDIPLNGQAGTFWYHSHLSSQYVDGLRGPLVVYDPQDPHLALYDIDDANTVITLADWYHTAAPALQEVYINGDGGGNHEPVPDTGLINGSGRYIGGPSTTRSRIDVVAGKKYRLRVINISAYSGYEFSIEGHRLTIIEVDGINHVPLTVDRFMIYAGQRYSVVLTANQPVKNYWIRAPMQLAQASDNHNLDTKVFAVLHYAGAPSGDPTTSPTLAALSGTLLEEDLLVPLENPGAPGGNRPADRTIDLNFQSGVSNGQTEWTINGIRYVSPDVPTLLKIMANNATTEQDFQPSEHTFVLDKDQIVDLVIHGSAGGHVHPFHLHGHAFDIIQGQSGPANYVNPPRRDVVGVGGSTVIIRFKADNPGPWFLHCHIDWHLEAGLAVVFSEAPNEQRSGPQSLIMKQAWWDLCPIYDALPPEQQ
ncbi:putative multicopper oxidase family protein [Lyophyllum shimeji]|uniref:Multicopper oxidase family protein n=1 Tax=Lyophyllum shimeji TaxID=47721 RepID=A0A9P3USS4_LYOSH|nr:putative multicopper oxidase family protein [Lyophyllum shimeji]